MELRFSLVVIIGIAIVIVMVAVPAALIKLANHLAKKKTKK
jgi:hypothetical protein